MKTIREATVTRSTNETNISLYINLDGTGEYDIQTGVGFLNHMLELFSRHSGFDLRVKCSGDINVDDHHSVEDVGISLGQAFLKASGDKKGINRYGSALIPMDEALIQTAADLSGRSYLGYDLRFPTEKIGSFDTELVEEFFHAFTKNACLTLHIMMLSGKNSHHIAEGAFKSVARALRGATEIDTRFDDKIPSTKGNL